MAHKLNTFCSMVWRHTVRLLLHEEMERWLSTKPHQDILNSINSKNQKMDNTVLHTGFLCYKNRLSISLKIKVVYKAIKSLQAMLWKL